MLLNYKSALNNGSAYVQKFMEVGSVFFVSMSLNEVLFAKYRYCLWCLCPGWNACNRKGSILDMIMMLYFVDVILTSKLTLKNVLSLQSSEIDLHRREFVNVATLVQSLRITLCFLICLSLWSPVLFKNCFSTGEHQWPICQW